MIPHFSTNGARAATEVPPPARFRPLVGEVRNAYYRTGPLIEPACGLTAAQRNGLRYEAKVQIYLRELFGPRYSVAPRCHFEDDSGSRTCIPDGVYSPPAGPLFVFEIKSQHMPEAWWQLRRLYQPVLEACRPRRCVVPIEVTKSYDPAQSFPEKIEVIHDLESYVHQSRFDSLGVFVWRP